MLKHIKILLSVLVALAFSACRDDDFRIPGAMNEDGEINLSFCVPEMESVSTRAVEYDIESLRVIVLKGNETSVVKQIKTFTGSEISKVDAASEYGEGKGNRYSVMLKLNDDLRGRNDLKFIVLANSDAEVADEDNYTAIQTAPVTAYKTSMTSMPMYGEASLAEVRKHSYIRLYRNAAKVSVDYATLTNESAAREEDKYTVGRPVPFKLYGMAESASAMGKVGDARAQVPASSDEFTDFSETPVYTNPTKKLSGSNRPYVILFAEFQNTGYYYRVNFEQVAKDAEGNPVLDSDGNKTTKFLDVESNHHYKIYVTAVTGKGYTTAAEAAKNPVSLIETEIIDSCPESYNMVTDGTRELGVSDVISFDEKTDHVGDTKPVNVLIYSRNEDDMDVPLKASDLQTEATWIELPETLPEPVASGDGLLYTFNITLASTAEPGTLETVISVNWLGLSRDVKVTYDRSFNPKDLCTAELRMYNSSSATSPTVTIPDYWAFLDGQTSSDNGGKTLYGVADGETGDSIRNEGLHFPVLYGDANKWVYEYKLIYEAPVKDIDYSFKFTASKVPGITMSTNKGTLDGTASANEKITLTIKCTNTDYNYQIGTLRLSVNAAGLKKPIPLDLDLYHTGFFHQESSEYEAIPKTQANDWCYYEVVKDNNGTLWLDRNVGAHTNALYIETLQGNAYYPETKMNAGGYYHGGKWGKENSTGYKYDTAVAYTTEVCPPGWEIPVKSVWANLRASSDFDTRQKGSYYDSSLAVEGNRVIHFPKYQYYNSSTNTRTGTSRAGYYWTKTPADGVEKEEIKKFLQTFVLEGSNPGFERAITDEADVSGNLVNKNGMAMAVRCVHNSTNTAESSNRTFFNVGGATHVYLYTEDADGNRTAATNWPGQFIGNYQTMNFDYDDPTNDNLFYFTYNSTTARASDLYVIFNYVDESGQIHSMSRRTKYNGANATARHTVGTAPASLYGWKVKGDNIDGVTTDVDGSWMLAYQDNSAKLVYSASKPVEYRYELRWLKTSSDFWKIEVVNADDSSVSGGVVEHQGYLSDIDSNTSGNQEGYKYVLPSSPKSTGIIVRFWNGNENYSKYYNAIIKKEDFRDLDGKKVFIMSNESNYSTSKPTVTIGDRPMDVFIYDLAGWGSMECQYTNSSGSQWVASSNISKVATVQGISGYKVSVPSNSTQLKFAKSQSTTISGTYYTFGKVSKNRIYFNTSDNQTPADGYNRVLIVDKDIYKGYTSQGNGIYIHYWGESSSTLPGKLMTRLGTTDIYWADFRAPNFLINNGVSTETSTKFKRQSVNLSYADDFTPGDFLEVSFRKYTYRISWYKDAESNGNYRNGAQYTLGGVTGQKIATQNDGTRYYIDVKAEKYNDTDKVTLYYNNPGNRNHEVLVKDKIQAASNQPYDYLIQVY